MKESHVRRQKRQPIPERVSGDGSAPPRFLVAVNFALQAACQSNPPVLLRYASSSQKIFALQIFFGSPVLLGFPCCSCCLLRGVCLAAARVSAPHLSMPSTRHGAKSFLIIFLNPIDKSDNR